MKDRLLIIDDELWLRESLRFLFKDAYDVVCADSVDSGVELLKNSPPHCIISDITMPGKTGIDGLKEIRKIDSHVSIIMLTASGSLETAQEAIRYGASDYLQKPFNKTELREVVGHNIQRTKSYRQQMQINDRLESLSAQMKTRRSEEEELAELWEKSSEFLHDIGNPISAIHGCVKMLMKEAAEKNNGHQEENVVYLEQIEKNVSRCREMLTMWRERAQKTYSVSQKVDIGQLAMEVAQNAYSLSVEKSAQVKLSCGPADCIVDGKNILLFRALQNIVGNALEALSDEGGVIDIRWRIEEEHVVLEVEDNGGGFPSEKLNDMQTKYYTAKGDSCGMGLGLFITKSIVEAHCGSLTLANNKAGTGALVTLTFPLLNRAHSLKPWVIQ
ncbi:MAG: response regulator [Pontiellaceae bacterium]|nr:response regulator [Pontiellaceae bacterium]